MDFTQLAAERYSCRRFSDRPVEQEKLAAILAAGRLAPTAKNTQPQRIYVLQSQDAIDRIRGLTRMAFNAPVVLLIGGHTPEGWVNPFTGKNNAEVDTAIVTTHMMLKAAELGLGTTWVGWFDCAAAHKLFDLPEDEDVYSLLPLGYPAEDASPSQNHGWRKPLTETVRYL